MPIRTGGGVGPEDHFQTGRFDRALEKINNRLVNLLHGFESRLRVVSDAQIMFLIIHIVVVDQPDLRVEPGVVLDHQPQIFVAGIYPMFDLRATGEHGSPDCVAVGVNQHAYAGFSSFVAKGLQLLSRKLRLATSAHALGCEHLHDLSAISLEFADGSAQLRRTTYLKRDRLQRSQKAWSRNNAAVYRVAQV